jgi:hypothetical protein
LPELGPVEHLVAAVVNIVKPRYVGERWPMLDPGETWDDLLPVYQPSNLMPVEIWLYALAGQLRLLGSVPKSTPGLVAILLDVSWDEAATLVQGDVLSRACTPPRPPGPESFPPELMILDRTRAASGRERIWEALRRYRDGDVRFVAEVGGATKSDDSPDSQLDERIFADLAQLAAVYDVLVREEVEVLLVRNW